MLEGVPLASLRGIVGLLLLTILVLFIASAVLPDLVGYLIGRRPQTVPLTPVFFWLNLATQLVFFFLIPVAYVRAVRPGGSTMARLGLRIDARTPRAIALGAAAAVAGTIVLALLLLGLRAAGLLNEPESPLVDELAALVRAHPEFVIVAPLAAGLFEETLFRGFLQPRVGLLASNVAFGLVHLAYGTVVQLVVPFVLGIALGLLYRRTKSLWAPVAAHATFDLIQLLLIRFAT